MEGKQRRSIAASAPATDSGRILREARKAKGWTIAEVSKRAGVSPYPIHLAEVSNVVTRRTAVRLARVLGIEDWEALVTRDSANY